MKSAPASIVSGKRVVAWYVVVDSGGVGDVRGVEREESDVPFEWNNGGP